MAESGLDLRTWLAVIGVFVLFFGFPAATIAFDLRKQRRQQIQADADAQAEPDRSDRSEDRAPASSGLVGGGSAHDARTRAG